MFFTFYFKISSSKHMYMVVIDVINDVFYVDIQHQDLSSLKYALTFMGWGAAQSSEDRTPPPRQVTWTKKIHSTLDCFSKDQTCNIIVTTVINPQHIYVQIVSLLTY